MISIREDAENFIIDFNENEDWESFNTLILILNKQFDLKILERNDGPESRVWHLKIEGFPLSLHHNPYGSFLKATSKESINFLRHNIEKFKLIFY